MSLLEQSIPLCKKDLAISSTIRGAALGLLLVFVSACGDGTSAEEAPPRVHPSVEAVEARHGSLPLTQRLSGVVEARNQVSIQPEITGVVTAVLAQNGDEVEAGQPLVRIRDTDVRERLKQARADHRIALAELQRAEARAQEARSALERARSLNERELGSEAELETVEARAASAEAEVALAEARVEQALAMAEEAAENLARTVIRAPITGVVGSREVEVGMLVNQNTQMFTIGQLDSVRVQVMLTDRMLAYVEEGQRAVVRVGDAAAEARLSRISPFLHPVAHSTEAEIDMPNPDRRLKPGMFVTVDIHYGKSEQATLVPISALYEDPTTGNVGVYVTGHDFGEVPVDEMGIERPGPLSEPVAFEFVPTPPIAEGHMEAAIPGIEPGQWVVTMGQNLLDGESPEARVRPIRWERVEHLQRLQREDLMREVIERTASD